MSSSSTSKDLTSSNNIAHLECEEDWAWTLVYSTGHGNHVVAKRRIQLGEVIVDEYGMAEGPDCGPIPDDKEAHDIYRYLCLNCYREVSETDKCSQCSWPICQNGVCDTKVAAHSSVECKILAQSKVLPNQHPLEYEGIIVIRILFLKETNFQTWEKILKMEANVEGRRKSEYEVNLTSYIIDFVRRCSLVGFDDEILERVIGVLESNKYWSHRDLENRFGSLIFRLVSFLNHDCEPNADEKVTEESVGRD